MVVLMLHQHLRPALAAQTGGLGVDAALNSLADDKLQATVRCLASHGRLLEIGKYDIYQNTGLGMRPMLKNIAFHGVDLDTILNGAPAEVCIEASAFGDPFQWNGLRQAATPTVPISRLRPIFLPID